MTKTLLLGAAAALILSAGSASAASHPSMMVKGHAPHFNLFPGGKGAKTLYDQTSAVGSNGVDSQNFESTYAAYDDQGADDFVVPSGATWTVTEVDAPGIYYNGSGPASSENVIFYSDGKGEPGKAVKGGAVNNVKGKDSGGSFTISLGKKGVTLAGGGKPGKKGKGTTYWVSVVANCSFGGGCGQWGWSTSTKMHGNGAQWQNPGGGFGVCPTWGPITTCISGDTDPDFAFVLKGTSKGK